MNKKNDPVAQILDKLKRDSVDDDLENRNKEEEFKRELSDELEEHVTKQSRLDKARFNRYKFRLLVTFSVGLFLLWSVDWKIAAGVFLLLWAHSIEKH